MSEFEFKTQHNMVIARFTGGLLFMAGALIIGGILTIVNGFIDGFQFGKVLAGIAWIAMGFGFYFPTDNFRNIVETEGGDITEMITGFSELRTAWSIVSGILIFTILFKILDLFNAI